MRKLEFLTAWTLLCFVVAATGPAKSANLDELQATFRILEKLGDSAAAREALEAVSSSAVVKQSLSQLDPVPAAPDPARLGLALVQNEQLRGAFLSRLDASNRAEMSANLDALQSRDSFQFLLGSVATKENWKLKNFNAATGDMMFDPPISCGFSNCSIDRLNSYKLGATGAASGVAAYHCYEHPDCMDRLWRSVTSIEDEPTK